MAEAKTKDDRLALFDAPASEKTTITHENPDVPAATAPGKMPAKGRAARQHEYHSQAMTVAASKTIVPMTDFQAALATFERLAVNPAVNPESLGKLLDVQERLLARNAKMAFDDAVVAMQADLPVFPKDGRIIAEGTSKAGRSYKQSTAYAKWETCVPILNPILQAHKLALTHRIETAPDGRVRVRAVLRGHGHTDDTCYLDLAAEGSGNKNTAQAWVSSTTYAKRVTGFAALGMVAREGDDDDGKASGAPMTVGEPVTSEQADQLIELCEAVGATREALLDLMNKTRPKGHPKAETIAQLPASRYDDAVRELRELEAYNARQATKGGQK